MDNANITKFADEYVKTNQSIDSDKIVDILRMMDEYNKYINSTNAVKVKYVDGEYGVESRKLGLIKYAYDGDAGIDLPVVLPVAEQKHGLTIYPGDRIMVHTGMILEFPVGYWGRITHRSSTEKRHRIRVIEGTIDDYRGEILVQVHNMNTFQIFIEHGQKLAQLIVCKTCSFPIVESLELRPSVRSSNGFGSTGK